MHVWHCTWKMKEYLKRKYKADLKVVNTVNNFSTDRRHTVIYV